MKRVLFVDDDPHLLSGLQNRLHKHRGQWDMRFALGGEAALEEMRQTPIDVIVTDMRMPGMDGATLLQKVKDDYPDVARIVLSGQAERESVLRTLEVAHQFLSKPIEGEALRLAIARACDLQALLKDETIRSVIGGLDRLPSIPQTYWELTRMVADPRCSMAKIAATVEQDPAISAKILQVVNSAYFGLAQQMTSIQQAITYLGLDVIKALALTANVFAPMNLAPVEGFSLDQLQKRSLMAAKLARDILQDRKQADEAFTAALLHDIGAIILVLAMPQAYAAVLENVRHTARPLQVVEKELLQVTHAEVGAFLLGMWGLPFAIVEDVALHHTPNAVPEGPYDVLAVLHVVAALVDAESLAEDERTWLGEVDLSFLERAGVLDQLPKWRQVFVQEFRRVGQPA
jgi:HD-like signal output (HDOD) protein